MDKPLAGKVALVTGAGRMRSIGREVALELARQGCDVVLNGSGSDPSSWPASEQAAGWNGLESVAEEIRALGVRALPAVADLRDRQAVDAMIARTVTEFGRLDVLVNNAAAPRGADRTPVVDLSDALWLNVLDVKLNGAFYASRAAARQMIAQGHGGHIVNISSVAGKRSFPTNSAYSVANVGLQMLGAVLANEVGVHGITVNSLCVGYTETSRIDDITESDAFKERLRQQVPLNRAAHPYEIAGVVAFLCRPEGSYITGQSISVDGGMVTP